VRIALGVSYRGSGFHGWQAQPGGGSVQDCLEVALTRVADRPMSVVAAGRTDAGVHATGQVIHLDTEVDRPLSAWVRGTNAHLPPSVSVTWACPVPDQFHARFSARSRTYHYLLWNDPVRPALMADLAGWFHRPLDLDAMREAARCLIGWHDFSSFRSAQCQARTPERELTELRIESRGSHVLFVVTANAFLHHMVRNLVGALVYVGSARLTADGLAALLAARDRRLAPPTFAAEGLCLSSVMYPAPFVLPAPATLLWS
jgi:tRNA pseudouridine38-40 synthase